MANVTVHIQGQTIQIDCAPHEQRRIADLAALLESRLAVFSGEPEAMRRLVLTALLLMDEAQAAGAALGRARAEIDRLNELVAEVQFESDSTAGRISSLTPPPAKQGAA
ncbi:MAG: cell division protein ZapA [Hyphomonadaceae bacterium]